MNWEIFFNSGAQTFIDIMTWVIISLFIFETINFFAKEGLYNWIKNSKKSQVLNAALLGLIPGCAGPLLLVPLYQKKKISLAALTAAFIATFGDAAFIILSNDPMLFLHLSWVGFLTAVIFGYALQLTKIGPKIEKKISNKNSKFVKKTVQTIHDKEKSLMPNWFNFIDEKAGPVFIMFVGALLFPTTIMTFVPAWENNLWIENSEWIAFVSTMIIISIYTMRKIMYRLYIPNYSSHIHIEGHEGDLTNKNIAIKGARKDEFKKTVHEAFANVVLVTTWVFIGLFTFDVLYFYMEESLNEFLSLGSGAVAILIAITIGLIPGCGPQIALANFYFSSGHMNFSALLSNSINQDGDAAFALVAIDYQTSFVMRFLNIIPALTVGFMFMGFENMGFNLSNI